jgi:hypothetical protein
VTESGLLEGNNETDLGLLLPEMAMEMARGLSETETTDGE